MLYADGFVKKGQLDLKLFRQLYWLAWSTFVAIELIVFAGTPIFRGNIYQSNSRGRICALLANQDDVLDDQEDSVKTSYTKFGLIVQLFYTIRFVQRIRSFVKGQCPRNILSSIGKYRRNVANLYWEFWCSVLWSFFPSIDFILRKISMAYIPHFAFFVNFVLIDSVLYFFFIVLFLALCQSDIPSKAETKKHPFYVAHPKHLEPRRPTPPNKCSLLGQKDKRVTDYRFPHIPLVRRTVLSSSGRQFKVINYVSSGETDILALKNKKCNLHGQEDKRVTDCRFPHIPLVRRTVFSSSGKQFKVINYVSTGETNNLPLNRKSFWLESVRCENICKARFLQVQSFKLDPNSDFVSNSNLLNICSSPDTVVSRFNYLKK